MTINNHNLEEIDFLFPLEIESGCCFSADLAPLPETALLSSTFKKGN